MQNDGFVKVLDYIRKFCVASVLHHFFELGIYEHININSSSTTDDIAKSKKLDKDRLEAMLNYLMNEGFIEQANSGQWKNSTLVKTLAPYKAWIEMMIGGYGNTFLKMDSGLRSGSIVVPRNLQKVGSGSCGISVFGALPLVKKIIIQHNILCRSVLDIGCGNGSYLLSLSSLLGNIKAIGIEPSIESCKDSNKMIAQLGLKDKIRVLQGNGQEFSSEMLDINPDIILICFVLHEILAQDGEQGVINFLLKLNKYFPDAKLIVVEVDDAFCSASIYSDPIYLGYYNPYFLLHHFTQQKLEKVEFWKRIFTLSGLSIISENKIESIVDSTGLEIGFLLSKKV